MHYQPAITEVTCREYTETQARLCCVNVSRASYSWHTLRTERMILVIKISERFPLAAPSNQIHFKLKRMPKIYQRHTVVNSIDDWLY